MKQNAPIAFATIAIREFAAAVPGLSLEEYAAACKARLAVIQGASSPSYEQSEAAYDSMIRQSYAIHCQHQTSS